MIHTVDFAKIHPYVRNFYILPIYLFYHENIVNGFHITFNCCCCTWCMNNLSSWSDSAFLGSVAPLVGLSIPDIISTFAFLSSRKFPTENHQVNTY